MAIREKIDANRVYQFATSRSGLPGIRRDADQQRGDAPDHGGYRVRSYGLTDGDALQRLTVRYELAYPESISQRPGALGLLARRLIHGDNPSLPLYIAVDEHGDRSGGIQCRRHPDDDRWHVQFLALSEPAAADQRASIALLEHAITEAGAFGARRLIARADIESDCVPTLRATGFAPFTRERVMTIAPGVGEADSRVRTQARSDVWSIHQLYLQTTPRDVQNAEALTSHAWDVDTEGRSQRGWFVGADAGALAFVRVRTSRHVHLLDTMAVPEARELLLPVVRTALAALQHERPRPTYLRIRGYQGEFEHGLQHLLQSNAVEQYVMVRYTTAPAPGAIRLAESFELLRPVETDPQRVPSFYLRDVHEHS